MRIAADAKTCNKSDATGIFCSGDQCLEETTVFSGFWRVLRSGDAGLLLGVRRDLFVPIFAIGRVPGWCASVIEQLKDNLLIRPLLRYEGPVDLQYVPIEQR